MANLAYPCPARPAIRDRANRGEAYHFVSELTFQQMVDRGEFAEWARVHGHLYGTAARTLETVLDRGEDILLDIDTQGARQLRARYPQGLYIFVVAPSMRDLEAQLKERKSDAPRDRPPPRAGRGRDRRVARVRLRDRQPSSRRGPAAARVHHRGRALPHVPSHSDPAGSPGGRRGQTTLPGGAA